MFSNMRTLLDKTGKDIYLALNNWGNEDIVNWADPVGDSIRLSKDNHLYATKTNAWESIKSNFFASLEASAANTHWDLDILQIGWGSLTAEEELAQLTLWSYQRAPLFISMALDKMTKATKSLLLDNASLYEMDKDYFGNHLSCNHGLGCTSSDDAGSVFSSLVGTTKDVLYSIVIVNWSNDQNFDYVFDPT
mmetsp:Transcript_24282/g.37465  ORF Transcript_24282/g.37465 Transcript_24282/m.37465 type:complete len:192 (-) Transcript_24282:176-751(-)